MQDADQDQPTKMSVADIRRLERADGSEAAERALIELIRSEPDNRLAYAALTRVLMRQRKYDYAVRAAERSAALAPLEPEAAILVGFAKMRADDRDGAAMAFRDALALDAHSPRAMMGAAILKMADENYDDALELCERAVEVDPSLEQAHQLIIRINMRQGRTGEALSELQKQLDSGDINERALRNYVRLMNQEGRVEEAIDNLAKLAGGGSLSRARFARLAAMSGKPDRAVEEYRKLVDRGEAKISDQIRLVSFLIRGGQLEEARKAAGNFPKARVLRPFQQRALGDVTLAEGKPDAAIVHYRRACKLARVDMPDEADVTGETPEDSARLWARYAQRAVRDGLRHRFGERNETA